MFRRLAANPLIAVCLGLPACAADGVAHAQSHAHGNRGSMTRRYNSPDDIVDAIATALEVSGKYRDVAVARADGYKPEGPRQFSAEGSTGIRYVHEGRLAAAPDVSRPPILVYLPSLDGLKLVAVEYFQPVIQDGEPYMGSEFELPRPDSLPARPPELFEGQPFDGPMAGHNPSMPWHYGQHVWLYTHNPKGLFATWNPALSAP
jgi:hypothetical protein